MPAHREQKDSKTREGGKTKEGQATKKKTASMLSSCPSSQVFRFPIDLQAAVPSSQSSTASRPTVPSIMQNSFYESLRFHGRLSLSHSVLSMDLELSPRHI